MSISFCEENDLNSAASALGYVQRSLYTSRSRFIHVESVLGARVPILKYLFDDTLLFDISWRNDLAVRNSALLCRYFTMYEQGKYLVILVKMWARSFGIIGSKNGNLSSYAFTNMVIYFLQGFQEVRLPVLSTDTVDADLEPRRITGTVSIGKLFIEFVHYYSRDFNWGNEVVSIRCGPRTSHESFPMLRNLHYTKAIHIEDPFELQRNLNSVFRDVELGTQMLRRAFQKCYNDFCDADRFFSILSQYGLQHW